MPQTDFSASKFFAWSLTVAVAVFSSAGLAQVFMPGLAGIATPASVVSVIVGVVSALCLANCMACHMQRSIAGERKFIGLFWLSFAATAALSLVSVIGVHLAWDQMALVASAAGLKLIPTEIVTAGAAVLAVIKPLSQFITEARASVEQSLYEEGRARADQRALKRNWDDGVLRPVETKAAAPAPEPTRAVIVEAPTVAPAAAPVVASITPFGVRLLKTEADASELAAARETVQSISSAILSQGFAKVVQARQAEIVEEAPAAAANVEAFDGMTTRERDALFAARFEECRALFNEGLDVSDVIAAKGWPRRTVRVWFAKLAAETRGEGEAAKAA
jgi:hypothetical protein